MGYCAERSRAASLIEKPAFVFSKQREEIVSVVVILLMFVAVIAMVKKLDDDRQGHAIPAANSRDAECGIGLQAKK
jgi:hypothetical protein